jgi:hypothetical protein
VTQALEIHALRKLCEKLREEGIMKYIREMADED